jgi:hypothetical protein
VDIIALVMSIHLGISYGTVALIKHNITAKYNKHGKVKRIHPLQTIVHTVLNVCHHEITQHKFGCRT